MIEPYAYVNRVLPARLEALAGELGAGQGARVLDYGCGSMPYRGLFAGADYVGADLAANPAASLELREDGTVPAEDSSFDVVVSTQVLEHADDPHLYLSECLRLLRPGGRLLLSTHGTYVYHPAPGDYWRWTCAGLRREVARAGFEVVRFEGVMGLAATGLQLLQHSMWVKLPRVLRAPLALVMQGMVAVADRLTSQASRDVDAAVFVLVAARAISGKQDFRWSQAQPESRRVGEMLR